MTTSKTPHLDRAGSRIDHLNIAVPDLRAAVAFYEPVLAAIGIAKMLEIPAVPANDQPAMTGFGRAEVKPYFWLIDSGTVGTNMHLAFTVDTREEVDVEPVQLEDRGSAPCCRYHRQVAAIECPLPR